MELTVAALVGADRNERMEVRLPGLVNKAFRGPSVAELLDDAALHLMEQVPGWPPEKLKRLVLDPDVCLRTVKVEGELAFGDSRRKQPVKTRLTVYCERNRADDLWVVRVPRLGDEPFAVPDLRRLRDGLWTWLGIWAKTGNPSQLEAARPLGDEHLLLLDVDVELPSVLPSRKPKKKRKKKKKGTSEPTPPAEKTWIPATELRSVGVNLVHRALDGRLRPALGRDALVDDLVEQLARDGTAILLVGPRGVGKTAVIEAVAQRFAARGEDLKKRTDLWRVSGGRLIAGMSYVGQWEARLARVVHEIHQRDDVLVVDDLPALAWAGRSAQSETTMSGFLAPHLERSELRILAECTPERLEAARLKDPGFFSYFRVIRVPVLDADATYEVLLTHTREAEAARNLVARPELLETLQQLATRFGPRMVEPGRSVTLARRFLGEVRGERHDRFGRVEIGPEHLRAHLKQETGLPDFVLDPGQGRTAATISAWFERQIIGQPNALACATDIVCTLQQGLDDPERPIATLLFVGPTGVGKTETAKALAAYLFGDASKLLRFDMSEVNGPAALHRLVGGPGRPDGDLTRAVANQPFSVVLLDEIEKASPQVFDLLLQVLGEGRLTNAAGETTDFRNTVLVMTSNLGARQGRRRTGFDRGSVEADATHYRSAAAGFFRPELFNRIDRIVPFRSLGLDDVEPLVSRIVARVLGRRGLRAAGVVVRLDDAMRAHLAEEGFDPQYGARSLQRVVERELAVPLARVVVDLHPGEEGLFLDVWREGAATRIQAHPLRAAVAEEGLGPLDDWASIRSQHAMLLDRVEALVEDARFRAVEDERSALLSRASGELSSQDWEQLHDATQIVETRSSVLGALEDFAADFLATHTYVDDVERVRVSRRSRRGWDMERRRDLERPRVIPVDRQRSLKRAGEVLLELELQLAMVLHRLASVPETVTLHLDPLHGEARSLVTALRAALSKATLWTAVREGDHLVLTGPGLRRLLTPFLGLYVRGYDVGADRHLELVRVGLDPLQRTDGPGTRALPAVRFRFGSLRPDDPLAPSLDTLADDLRRLALLPEVR